MSGAISSITIKDFLDTLPYIHPKQTVLMRGRHGIGKSDLAYQAAKIWNLDVVVERRIAQLSEGDMIGLPDRDATRTVRLNGEERNQRVTSFLPTDWFVTACEQPTLVFLDEINRGTPEVQQACFQFVEKGEMNGRKIHPKSRIIAAVNFSREYNVTNMGIAFLDRFAIYDIEPTKKDWITWAKSEREIDPNNEDEVNLKKMCRTNVHHMIIDFIMQCNKDHFEILPEKQVQLDQHEITPTRRSWARLSNHLVVPPNDGMPALIDNPQNGIFYYLARSFVGPDAARALQNFCQHQGKVVTPKQVLTNCDEVADQIKNLNTEEKLSLCDKVLDYIERMPEATDAHAKELRKFVKTIPDELAMVIWDGISSRPGNQRKTMVFHRYISSHFMSLIADTRVGDKVSSLREKFGRKK